MCDPVSIALTVASSLASSFMQSKAEDAVNKKRQQAIQGANRDLDRYRDKASKSYQNSVDAAGKEGIDAGMASAEADLSEDYQKPISQDTLLPGQGDSSDAVKQSIVQSLSAGQGRSRESARKRATLDSYGDAAFNRNLKMRRAGQDIDQQASFAAGRADVLPFELEEANMAGDKYGKMAGMIDGLGALGSAAYGNFASKPSMYNTGHGSTGVNYIKGKMGQYGPGF